MLNSCEPGAPSTSTVTLLVADAGSAAMPWQLRPEPSLDGAAPLDHTLAAVVAAHRGARLVEQDQGDLFAATFGCPGDAVECAIALQRAPLAPIRLRIAVHTGEMPIAQHCKFSDSVFNRAVRLCDLAHDGQTVLSEATEQLVSGRMPADSWLTELGSYPLSDMLRPERVTQLCHHDLVNDFPALRARRAVNESRFPTQLTSFVGRGAELAELRLLICRNRLVTLTGTGGVGKTRLALQLVEGLAGAFTDGLWWVDLAAVTDSDLVAERVVRTLGLPDQPGRSPVDTLVRVVGNRRMLLVLDNCEHLLDVCASLVTTLLGNCAGLSILTTSREPIGVTGEVTWLTPPLSLADEAVWLFTQRARLVRPDFDSTGDNAAAVAEICRSLDGVPLAIELAATRVRILSLTEIVDGVRERFALLTGGARTVLPRQQTLRASVDWSHALLSDPERAMFARLAVFVGGFSLDAAHAVAGVSRSQTLDELTQLVDKSLVLADHTGPVTRYRMLETIRHYALEKLDSSDEAEAVRTRHRDHYTALFDTQATSGYRWQIEQAEIEFDNLRAAFGWSIGRGDLEFGARLASSLQPLWLHSQPLEGLAWYTDALADSAALTGATRARALADKTILEAFTGDYFHIDQAEQAVRIARQLQDPVLLARALTAYGFTSCFSPEIALPYLQEAMDLAPALNDDWQLSQILFVHAFAAYAAGDLSTVRRAAGQGRDLADAVGDSWVSRRCRWCLGLAQLQAAELAAAAEQFRDVAAEAHAAHDLMFSALGLVFLGVVLACQGDISGALTAAEAGVEAAADLPVFQRAASFGGLVGALLAAGDVPGALAANDAACEACAVPQLLAINGNPAARAVLAAGDVAAARRWADGPFAVASGVHRVALSLTRVRVALAEGAVEQAQRDVRDGLTIAAEAEAYLAVPDLIECLATLAADAGRHRDAAQLFGSAAAIRERTGTVRYRIYDADYNTTVNALCEALGQQDFDAQWAFGAALSTAEAVAYACRSRNGRHRPSNGWPALTPAECDVVRLVSAGLGNKDIAAKLSISPRTVDTHLTHIYAKLDLTSRVQLAREAARQSA